MSATGKYYDDEQIRKTIRDPVHGYINLTEFQLKLIDTLEFQRLKDIRQLTGQHVYPSARHTRFEHSLGVMELTRKAIKRLDVNGIIDEKSDFKINPRFASLTITAALLHDVGHFPFSHMGEVEADSDEIRKGLENELKKIDLEEFDFSSHKSKHEQMSCIVIISKYPSILKCSEHFKASGDFKENIEFIVRCILGIKYKFSASQSEDASKSEDVKIRNLLINLINSKFFDLDKLDYIMRDSYHAAIGAPQVDAKRLFRNMYVALNAGEYEVAFSSKAVPALQNLTEARDSLYMLVCNHHTVIYSNFIYSYIFRHLGRLAGDSKEISIGRIPKSAFFSIDAITERHVSDADIQSALNAQLYYSENLGEHEIDKKIKDKVIRVLELIDNLARRKFLTPWWKTAYEYDAFMKHCFRSTKALETIPKRICDEKYYGSEFCAEFRSQIAKGVIKLSEKIVEKYFPDDDIEKLENGDFFVVQCANNFFGSDVLGEFKVYLKKNEIVGKFENDDSRKHPSSEDYYDKKLTELLPRRDFDGMFGKNSFYVYMRKCEPENKQFYEHIEKALATVSTKLANISKDEFNARFVDGKEDMSWENVRV